MMSAGTAALEMVPARATAHAAPEPTVLIVSPHFPPSTLAGVHRARHLAKHLPAHGWRPIVIRVDDTHYTERADAALAALVPASVQQIRCGAIPASLARLAGIGDISLRGYFPLRRAVAEAVVAYRPHAILITGSPYYPMLLSSWIKQHTKIPVVLDFQDPWVSAEGAMHQTWTKAGLVHRLAVALEPRAVRQADFVTSVSARQNAEMALRYAWLDPRRMAAIPIGGDPDDFDALRSGPPSELQVQFDPDRINLSYVGTFLPRAEHLVRTIFRAASALKQTQPELAARIRLNFIGTSNQPDRTEAYRVRPIAEEEGVGDLVSETPQRVPYLEALYLLAMSHGLLLIGSDEPHYTASKIYPALMSGRPYVSLFHRQSSAHDILAGAGGGRTFCFDTPDHLATLVGPLAAALADLAASPGQFGRADPAAYDAYTAHSVAGDFARVLDQVASSQPR
ncbi:MAG: hypothetical protein ABS54_08620 [Hyphomicrobium sp. SCN 65-11]|nr:MAG: hypothetical protein ABS54_08620 [Hyphomicrobium sp. SCN 65-11]